MRSRPVRSLADRVAALEDQVDGLASSMDEVSDADDHGDGGTPEHDPADQSAKISARPVREIGVSVRSDLPGFVGLEIVDYAGKPHRFLVQPSDLALLLPTQTQALATSAPTAPAVDPDEVLTLARARLTNAEAELKELEHASRRRPSDGKPFWAERLTVGFDEERGTLTTTVRDSDGLEIRVECTPDRARWLAEHLLTAARELEPAGR